MKILFVLPQIYPFYTGGAEIFHYHLLKELSQENEVAYIGFDNINESSINCYPIKKIKPWRIFTPLQIIIKLIVLSKKFDIIHLNYSQGSWLYWFFYPLLKKTIRIKYCITIHDPSLFEWKNKKIFKKVFREASFIAAVSERLKDGYEKRCGREIIYLPPLIPLKQSGFTKELLLKKMGFNIDDNVFLFAGSIKDSKRPLLLIEAINEIDRKWLSDNHILFLFVGDGGQKEESLSKINSYNLSHFIKLIGRVPQEIINEYYKLSSFYIIPSIHEGKSMSLIEAMFNRLPIIASDAPGINDIIFNERNGLLFKLDNKKQLAEQINRIVNNPGLASELAKQAYEDYLINFQFKEILGKYIHLYNVHIH